MTSAQGSIGSDTARRDVHRHTMWAIGFLSFFDRFSAAPMLVLMALQLHTTFAVVTSLLAAYSLAYALGQPVWGVLGDRLGRRRTLALALSGAAAASAVTALVPTAAAVFVARVVTGLFIGALFPTILTMTGDAIPAGGARSRAVSNLQTATALGTTVATLVAAALAAWAGWRVLPALVAIGCVVLLGSARRLPASHPGTGIPGLPGAAGGRWPLVLYALAFWEGALLLGVLAYIAPAIAADAVPAALAGMLAASYGMGIVGGAQLAKALTRRWARSTTMLVGATILIAAYLIAAADSGLTLTVAAVLVGLSNALLHSNLQAWATEIAPSARATTVSLFACALFIGAAAATWSATLLVGHGYTAVFLVAALAGVPLLAAIQLSYRAWTHRGSMSSTEKP